MNVTFSNGDILKQETVYQNERVMLGGNSLYKCFLYDSAAKSYDELKDYEIAKAARRKFYLVGEKTSYRELYYVYIGVSKTTLCFDDCRPQHNSQGYWVCKHYVLELNIKVKDPKTVIRLDIRNVNQFISSNESKIKKMVVRCKTGGQLRATLNECFAKKGLTVDYVSVSAQETSSGLTEAQKEYNEKLSSEVKEHHKNKITDIQGSGRRDQQLKDAQTQLDIKKINLALEYTEKKVRLDLVFSALQQLNIPDREKDRGMAILAEMTGVQLSPQVFQLLNKKKCKRGYHINLP